MPAMVNPHDALSSYQQALLNGGISPSLCPGYHDLYVLRDEPAPGSQRLTYALISRTRVVKGLAIYADADPIEGCPCFGVGYAVAEPYRGQGLAKTILTRSTDALREGMARHLSKSTPGFYVEAIVGVNNLASNKVAASVLNETPEPVTDKYSSEPAMHYVKFVSWDGDSA